MSARSASPRTWWLLAILFTVTGALWLVIALLPNSQDPIRWLRFAVPIVWLTGAVVAAVRAHRAGSARTRD